MVKCLKTLSKVSTVKHLNMQLYDSVANTFHYLMNIKYDDEDGSSDAAGIYIF